MFEEYKLNKFLNKNKLFEYVELPDLGSFELPPIPDDWREYLVDACHRSNESLAREEGEKDLFERHLDVKYDEKGEVISYEFRLNLIKQLKLIYHRLTGNMDKQLGPLSEDDRHELLLKMTEDVDKCSPGFHNRVNLIVDSFQDLTSFSQLLYQVRKNLVENVAVSLNKQQDVHTWNRITVIANNDGLGIRPNLKEDCYRGGLSDRCIRLALEKEFLEKYTPFRLPFLLCDVLKELIVAKGYVGPKEKTESYSVDDARAIALFIAKLFIDNSPLPSSYDTKFDYTKYCIIDEDTCHIFDANWPSIRLLFFEKLKNEGYFKETPYFDQITDQITDYIYYSQLFPLANDANSQSFVIHSILKMKDYDFLNKLTEIKENVPYFYEELLENKELIDRILSISISMKDRIFKFKKEFLIDNIDKILVRYFNIFELLKLLHDKGNLDDNGKSILDQLKKSIIEIIGRDIGFRSKRNALMRCVRDKQDAAKSILDFINKNKDILSDVAIGEIFLKVDFMEWNALSLSSYHCPIITKKIMMFFSDYYKDELNKEKKETIKEMMKEMVTKKMINGWNALMVAAYLHPALVEDILYFIDHNKDVFDDKVIREILMQKTFGLNALMLAVHFKPVAIKAILGFIEKNKNIFNEETLKEILVKNDRMGRNILLKKARELSSVARAVISLSFKIKGLFNKEELSQIKLSELSRLDLDNEIKFMDNIILDDTDLLLKHFSKYYFIRPNSEFYSDNLKPVTDKLFEKYYEELNYREGNQITHISRFLFFKAGYSTKEKMEAAKRLKEILKGESHHLANDLESLKRDYPALSNGRLGRLFSAYCTVAKKEKVKKKSLWSRMAHFVNNRWVDERSALTIPTLD